MTIGFSAQDALLKLFENPQEVQRSDPPEKIDGCPELGPQSHRRFPFLLEVERSLLVNPRLFGLLRTVWE